MNTLIQDLRYGLRMLMKQRGFTAVALLALALGIGANTAIFSVVNAVLLKPLPYREPDQLVRVYRDSKPMGKFSLPTIWGYPQFEMLRDQNQSFEAVAAYVQREANLTGTEDPERLKIEFVSASYFPLLGIDAVLGRTFLAEEDQKTGAQPVALIGHGLWQRRFGGDPGIQDKTIELDKKSFTIIGVLPASFKGQQGSADVWLPIAQAPLVYYPRILTNPNNAWLQVLARVKPGLTPEQAQADLLTVGDSLATAFPKAAAQDGDQPVPRIVSLREANVDPMLRRSFLILLVAVGFVLLIACANTANLLLARAISREKEFAVRLAVGASRGRIIRQLLTESVMLSVAGGIIGLLVALWGIDLLTTFKPSDDAQFWTSYTRTFDFFKIGLDGRVLAFNLLLSMTTGIIFGLLPALQSSRPNLNETLKESSPGAMVGFRSLRHLSPRALLVVAQIALSLVLLVGAGLMIKSLLQLQAVRLGFEPQKVMTMTLASRRAKADFYDQVLERVTALPGVEAASIASTAPLLGYSSKTMIEIEGRSIQDDLETSGVGLLSVSPAYFQTLGIPIVQGRAFTNQDRIGAPRVAIINRAAADLYWPGEEAIGKRLKVGIGAEYENAEPLIEVVGLVGNVTYGKIEERVEPDVYLSSLQPTDPASTLIIRSPMESAAIVAAVRREVMALDKNVPLTQVRTMAERSAEITSRTRFIAVLLGIFAGLALLLASVGIYGVMAYSVSTRTHEIGIRLALGARAADVFRLVMKEGLALVTGGLVVGIGAAFFLTQVLSNQLFGVTATDSTTFAAVAAMLAVVALAACFVPARRATKVEPMQALRYE